MFEKLKKIILFPYTKYKEHQAWKKRLKELRERDPFIYK